MGKKTNLFLLWLLVLSAAVAVCHWILTRTLDGDSAVRAAASVCHSLYLFTPAIAAIIVEKWKFRQIAAQYRFSFCKINVGVFFKYLIGTIILFPALIVLLVWLLGNVAGIEVFGRISGAAVSMSIVCTLLFGLTVGFLTGLGGELGWRGLMWNNLNYGCAKKNLLTGVVWGVWNIPIILLSDRSDPLLWIAVIILFCIVCSFYLSNALRESRTIFLPALIQGVIGVHYLPVSITGGDTLLTGVNGLVAVAAIVVLTLLFRSKKAEASS